MRHTNRFTAAALGLCLTVASFGAFADDGASPDFAAIRAQQVELRAEVEAGNGIFGNMNSVERKELASRQSQLLAMIDGKQSIDEFDDDGQVRVFNLLEQINAQVNNAEDSRMVCEYTKKTGSHRKVKECKTVAERRRDRDDSQQNLEHFRKGLCTQGGAAC